MLVKLWGVPIVIGWGNMPKARIQPLSFLIRIHSMPFSIYDEYLVFGRNLENKS